MSKLVKIKKGTTKCPKCNTALEFEVMGTMRIIRNGEYSAYCPKHKKHYKIPANEKRIYGCRTKRSL